MFDGRKTTPRRRRRLLCAGMVLFLTLGACELSKGDTSSPAALYYALVEARQQTDRDPLWELLHPDTRDTFGRWVTAERDIHRIVVVDFPSESQAEKQVQADALGVLTVQKHLNGKALFATLLGDQASPLETWTRLGAHVRSVERASGSATVRTWGGDDLRARKHHNEWYAVLPLDLEQRLEASATQAVKNLEQVRALAARLKK